MNLFLDQFFSVIDRVLGLSKLSVTQYLFIVAVVVMVSTIALFKRSNVSRRIYVDTAKRDPSKSIMVSMIIAVAIIVVGIATSYNAYHYSPILVFSLLLTLTMVTINVYLLKANGYTLSQDGEGKLCTLYLILTVLLISIGALRPIVNGIEEQETTSDTINIYMNGYFRYSIHGTHYDLMPVDSVIKVFLLRVLGVNNIFDPFIAFAIYVSSGLTMVLSIYAFLRREVGWICILIPLTLFLHPYSTIVGLSLPPAPLSQALAVTSLTILLSESSRNSGSSYKILLVTIPMIIVSIFAHPTSIGLITILTVLLIALKLGMDGKGTALRSVTAILAIATITYFSKVLYTAFTQGFINYLNTLKSYILAAFEEERPIVELTTRNPGYSALPRITLTGFAVFPAIVAGYTLLILPGMVRKMLRREVKFIDIAYLSTVVVYGISLVIGILTGIGGVSQSRIVMNGFQPYAELIFIMHVLFKRVKTLNIKPNDLALLLLVASITTIISPNMLPNNYTIGMAAKSATYNDHMVSYTFYAFIDPHTFMELLGKIEVQQHSTYAYNLGSTMAIVYYYIAPQKINLKSYWELPKGILVQYGYKVKAFHAWVYEFYVYTK